MDRTREANDKVRVSIFGYNASSMMAAEIAIEVTIPEIALKSS